MFGRLVLFALVSATAVSITLVTAIAGDGTAKRIRPCHGAQVRFVVDRQPVNSATTGFSITATTRVRGVACVVRGYPSLTLPAGDHGPVALKMNAHLVGGLGPEHVVTLSSSKAKSGGFYVFNTRGCDAQSGEVFGSVRFGLPNGDRAPGSAWMTFCKTSETVLALSPFLG